MPFCKCKYTPVERPVIRNQKLLTPAKVLLKCPARTYGKPKIFHRRKVVDEVPGRCMKIELHFLLVFVKHISELLSAVVLIPMIQLNPSFPPIVVCIARDAQMTHRLIRNVQRIIAAFIVCRGAFLDLISYGNLSQTI